jgi:hypothetical protein
MQNVQLKTQSELLHMNAFTHTTTKTNENTEFVQLYLVAAADALPEISTAVVSAGVSFDEHLSHTNTSCIPKCSHTVFLSLSVLSCQQAISMRSNVRE